MDLLEAWVELRKPQIDARVFGEGLDLPGYTKVKKDGAPFIPAEKSGAAWELLRADLTPEQFIAACGKPSLSKLVDQLADACPAESLADRKAQARERLFTLCEELVQQSKPTEYLRRRAKLDLKLLGG